MPVVFWVGLAVAGFVADVIHSLVTDTGWPAAIRKYLTDKKTTDDG
jgi:hypothetical protein